MADREIKTMKPRHDAIAEWLLAHPTSNLTDCANAFGVTSTWLSIIVNSDIFRAYYEKIRGEYVDTRIIPLRDKLMGVTHAAVDRLSEVLEKTNDGRLVLDIADKMLTRLVGVPGRGGVSAMGPPPVQPSTLTPTELDLARQRYKDMQRGLSPQDVELVDGVYQPVATDEADGEPAPESQSQTGT